MARLTFIALPKDALGEFADMPPARSWVGFFCPVRGYSQPLPLPIIDQGVARSRGLLRYHTGRACHLGHYAERWTAGLHCCACYPIQPKPRKAKARRVRERPPDSARPLRVPAWADRKAIDAIYFEAARISYTTGVLHHVDHIVPINSPLVCGLHCEANLRVLDARENALKSNRWWPDMP